MSTRKILYNNDCYYFNTKMFLDLFNSLKKDNRKKVSELEIEMAEALHVSKETVHNWRFCTCGPSSIELINDIKNFFKLKDVEMLLVSSKRKEKNMNLTDLQILSLKRIYDSIIDFLFIFDNSDGFNDYWYDLKCSSDEREDKLYDIAFNEIDKVILTYKKEHIFLKDFDFYNKIGSFIYNDLYDTFDGKLSYAYRFEAIPDGNPTTSDDYYKALEKINSIIEEIM